MTPAPKPHFTKNCMCDKYTSCTDCQHHDATIRKEERERVLDELGVRLNSWIASMEILDSKHPSPLRKGIIMAYRDVKEWERQMRKMTEPLGNYGIPTEPERMSQPKKTLSELLSVDGDSVFTLTEKQFYGIVKGWTHLGLMDKRSIFECIYITRSRPRPHTPAPETKEAYHNGFDEGFEIGKAQCETHHEELAAAIRNATLDSVQKLLRKEAQIDENDQYYLWLEDIECAVESLRDEL